LPAEQQEKLAGLGLATSVEWASVRALKRTAIDLAFARFQRDEWRRGTARARQLTAFMRDHRAWLDDYALFAVEHDRQGTSWLDWSPPARDRDPATIDRWRDERRDELLKVSWVQWQLDEQWRQARRQASAVGVNLMGDLPFVSGFDSADVWANRSIFHLDRRLGAPPDPGAPEGQDWGLPVYDWEALRRSDHGWIRARATRAGQLFSLFRIDHAIGFYRTYFRSADGKTSGFSPADEAAQLRQGDTLMRRMSRFGEAVAEDLGAPPPFLRPSLEHLSIPGYRVLRWEREGDAYRDPASWPEASVATNGTHDTDSTAAWYDGLQTAERERLRALPGLAELDPDRPFDDRARDLLLRAIYAAPSTLTLIPFQDALGTRERINVPGSVGGANWSVRLPKTIEELEADTATTLRLSRLAAETGRPPARRK
jgi:4-alpha-glucanotransferase